MENLPKRLMAGGFLLVAGGLGSIGIGHGVAAFNENNKAIEAHAVWDTLNYTRQPGGPQWEHYAQHEEFQRDKDVIVSVPFLLGAVAALGTTVTSVAGSRKVPQPSVEVPQTQPAQSPTPEQ